MKYDFTELTEFVNDFTPEAISNDIDEAIFAAINVDGDYRLDDIAPLISKLKAIRDTFRNIKPIKP